jgi:membrane-anchored glycerophosphoryl diester phosphodiesterase (GDPDase)
MGVPAVTRATLFMVLILLPIAFYFGARLLAMTPVAAAESVSPFEIIGRSWRLTAPFAWKLVAFLVLTTILIGVLRGAIGAVAGILFALFAGPLEPGSTSAWLVIIVMARVNTVVVAYFASRVARIYAQLSGDTEVSRTFT